MPPGASSMSAFITTEGTLWLLDFGAVGRLDPVSLEALQGMAIGFAVSDGSVIARAVRHLVGDDRSDMRLLERDLSLLLGEGQGGAGMSPAVLSGVLGVMERHGVRPPRALVLLTGTVVPLEGTLRLIAPEFDLAAEARKLVGEDGLAAVGPREEIL